MPLSIDDDIYNLTITASDVSGAGAPSSNQTYTFTNTGLFWQGASATEGVNSGTGLAGLTPRYFYYSSQWQLIQEDANNPETGTDQTADQYVWGMAYVNELVLRDSNSDGESSTGNLGISGSGLDQRLYVQQDANWNVTALVNTSGTVVERYTYDAYGNVTVLNADGTIKGNGSISASSYGMVYLFQGERLDTTTDLYVMDNRLYNPNTGTWDQQDPMGYINGLNLYQFENSNSVNKIDPLGTDFSSLDAPIYVPFGGLGGIPGAFGPPSQTLHEPDEPPYKSELEELYQRALEWNKTSPGWSFWWWGLNSNPNECCDQAHALAQFLQKKNPRYWTLCVYGGTSNAGIQHNILHLIPANGNPMNEQYFDPYKNPLTWLSSIFDGGNVGWGNFSDFQQNYPNPIEGAGSSGH